MDDIRTTAEAEAEARRLLGAARDLLRQAMRDVRGAEDALYGHVVRSLRAQLRVEDAIEAVVERLRDLGPGEPDQADEPVDLASPPTADDRKLMCGENDQA